MLQNKGTAAAVAFKSRECFVVFFFICVVEKVEAAGKISYKSCVVSILDVLFTGKYICCLASKAYELPAWLLLSL